MTNCYFLGAKLMHFESKKAKISSICLILFYSIIHLLAFIKNFFRIVSKMLEMLINCYFLPKGR